MEKETLETVVMFGPEFWSILVSMAVFAPVAALIVRGTPEMNQVSVRKVFGIAAIITMGYNFYAYGTGAWSSVIETAIQFFVMTYLFAVVAEKRLVPPTELWSGPPQPQKRGAKKKAWWELF